MAWKQFDVCDPCCEPGDPEPPCVPRIDVYVYSTCGGEPTPLGATVTVLDDEENEVASGTADTPVGDDGAFVSIDLPVGYPKTHTVIVSYNQNGRVCSETRTIQVDRECHAQTVVVYLECVGSRGVVIELQPDCSPCPGEILTVSVTTTWGQSAQVQVPGTPQPVIIPGPPDPWNEHQVTAQITESNRGHFQTPGDAITAQLFRYQCLVNYGLMEPPLPLKLKPEYTGSLVSFPFDLPCCFPNQRKVMSASDSFGEVTLSFNGPYDLGNRRVCHWYGSKSYFDEDAARLMPCPQDPYTTRWHPDPGGVLLEYILIQNVFFAEGGDYWVLIRRVHITDTVFCDFWPDPGPWRPATPSGFGLDATGNEPHPDQCGDEPLILPITVSGTAPDPSIGIQKYMSPDTVIIASG